MNAHTGGNDNLSNSVRPQQNESRILDDGFEESEGEEGVVARVRGKEWQPTAREIEEHNVSHIPFRSWCVHCVKGKAVSAGHYRVQEDGSMPKVHMDWCWMCPKEEG